MEFRLLGAFEVSEAGRQIPLGGPRQRAVLIHLLLRANQTVATDRLIDEVWDHDPPAAARSTLRGYVSHLRSALGADRLASRPQGYAVLADASEIDATRFEVLVAEGRRLVRTDPAAAERRLHDALGLWRGPALDDCAGMLSLHAEIARLEELKLVAIEDRFGAQLQLGRHRELIPDLQTLIQTYPLRERLWQHLIVALYRSGRQGEALAAYQRARDVLADELGIDPSPDLRHLQEQVLRQDPALAHQGAPLRGYRLLERIGAGAFGSVHRAFQPQVDREVAVKVMHPVLASDPSFIRTFEVEAQLIARIEHPHIVPLYDYWRDPDGAYLVMRFLRGGNLRDRLDAGLIDLDAAVLVVDQIALALASAHRQGVIHRDVKPENVLFDEDGNAYLTDFGIATDQPAVHGKPSPPGRSSRYQAPETVNGGPASHASDIYNLGAVTSEMLGDHAASEAVARVLARATAADRKERYAEATAFAEALRSATALAPSTTVIDARNPYRGLEAFTEADTDDFFGRESLVSRLVSRLDGGGANDGPRLLVVVGPSGSGKSSVVHAGLIPALRRGEVTGSQGWFIVQMRPTAHPFEALEAALLRVAITPPPNGLASRLVVGEEELDDVARRLLPADSELVVVIDQFEELFTLVDDETMRAAFLSRIVHAVTASASTVHIVITLRADVYDRPLQYAGIAELIGDCTEVVRPLSAEELERAIVGPAQRVGVTVESLLVAQMVADVANQPGALPLLQYALTELFDRRERDILTATAYRDMGGVSGALVRRAGEVYSGLPAGSTDATKQAFLRLVTLREGADHVRRRVLRTELLALDSDPDRMDSVIRQFSDARLLSLDRDPETRGPTVEVAHEALLREWDRLRDWIESARGDLATQRWLATATREWLAAGRDAAFLVTGSRLERLAEWLQRAGLATTSEERDYLDASVVQRDRAAVEEAARRSQEQTLERRSLLRLRALVAVLATFGVVAAGLTILTIDQRERAEEAAMIAGARELASAAVANLEVDPERAILLAAEAVEQTRSADGSVLREAVEALHRAVIASRVVMTVAGVGGWLDWSPDGSVFVTEGPEDTGVIDVRDAHTGESLLSWHGHEVDINAVAFNHDGSMLATTGDDGATRVWDPALGTELSSVGEPSDGQAWGPSFSPDGSLVVAAWPELDVVRLWEPTSGREVREFTVEDRPEQTAFSPDSSRLAVGGLGGPAPVVLDARSGEHVLELAGHDYGGLSSISWSPDGRWLTTTGADETTRLWDADTGALRFTITGHTSWHMAADWSPDSTRLATGGNDGFAKVWEVTPTAVREVLVLPAHDSGVYNLAFSPDGERLMTGDTDVTAVTVWDISLGGSAEWVTVPGDGARGGVGFSRDGDELVVSRNDEVISWDAQTGTPLRTIARHADDVRAMAVSPVGDLVASVAGNTVTVSERATGLQQHTIDHADSVAAVAWSADGELLAATSGDRVTILDRFGAPVTSLRAEEGLGFDTLGFSQDGRLIGTAVVSTRREEPLAAHVAVWDWRAGEIITRVAAGAWVGGIAFDTTGPRIAAGHAPSVWDLDTGQRVIRLAGRTGDILTMAYSADGAHIAAGSTDGTIRLWDATSGIQSLELRAHEGLVTGLVFSRDGTKLASSSTDGTARVWALDLDDLLAISRTKLTRRLSEDECRQYLHLDTCPAE